MMKKLLPLGLLLFLLTFSGCTVGDKVAETFHSVAEELAQAGKNVADKFNDVQTWFSKKFNQAEQASTDIQEAAESLDEAMDSVQTLAGTDDEEEPKIEETP